MSNEISFDVLAGKAPNFAVGEWIYVPHKGHNARVISVEWDKSLNGYAGGWRYFAPGYNDPHPYQACTSAPYVEYERTGLGWAALARAGAA